MLHDVRSEMERGTFDEKETPTRGWFTLRRCSCVCVEAGLVLYVHCPCMSHSLRPLLPLPCPPLPSSCWWPWCRSPAWWSFAGSRGESSCRRASPVYGLRPPACPPSDLVQTGRRGGGNDTPASQPPPAHAGLAASHTLLYTKRKKGGKKEEK